MGHHLVLLLMQATLLIAPGCLGNTPIFPSIDLEDTKEAVELEDRYRIPGYPIPTARNDYSINLTHTNITELLSLSVMMHHEIRTVNYFCRWVHP